MFSITIYAETSAELANIVKHIELVPFLSAKTGKKSVSETATVPTEKAEKVAKSEKAEKPAKAEKVKEEPTVTYEQVREATFSLAAVPGNGPALVKEALKHFEVDHATKLVETEWQKYIDLCAQKVKENTPEESLA